jgi:drug/metabolite transporter (DMT)-like permease
MGAANVAVPFWLVALGEHTVSSGVTAVLLATSPAIVSVLASRFDISERLHWSQWIGVAVATGGVAVIVGASPGQARSALGVLAVIGAAGSYAAGSLLAKQRADEEPWLQAVVTLVIGGALLTVPAVLSPPSQAPSLSVWLALAALACVGTAMSLVLLFTAVGLGGAGYSLVPLYLSPGVSIAGGALVLGDPVTGGLGAGFAIAILGVLLATRRGAERVPGH